MRLCPKCLGEFKRSKEGKALRRSRGGTWAGISGQWPRHLYHTNDAKLCASHQAIYAKDVRRCYDDRDTNLKALGFLSYDAYLKSELWNTIRLHVLLRDNNTCRCCGKAANQVHHKDYSIGVLRGDYPDMLIAICGDCHKEIEFLPNGDKRLTSHANIKAKELSQSARLSRDFQ